MGLAERWNATCADVADVCRSCGRSPESVKIIAVSKTVEPAVVGEGIACGMTDFGENRTDKFNEKYEQYPQAHWHLIGQLQSRKAREVVGKAELIHSLDRPSLLKALAKAAEEAQVTQDVLIEVSISGEESKGGCKPEDVPALLEQIDSSGALRCKGLMTMAPQAEEAIIRATFAGLRELAESLQSRYGVSDSISFSEISMGMSGDYAIAIEEGATMVRIGRRIFSADYR